MNQKQTQQQQKERKPLHLLEYPDPLLKRRSELVTDFNDPELHQLVTDLYEIATMLGGPKAVAGLAAPQLGFNVRVFMALGKIYINPEITWKPAAKEYYDEGCFSIMGKRFRVWRPYAIRVKYQGPDGKFFEEKLTGVRAEVFQHEYDHLEGLCIADIGTEIPPTNI